MSPVFSGATASRLGNIACIFSAKTGNSKKPPPYSVTAKQRSRIGMIFQSFNLVPHMTVLENVIEVPVHVHGENPGIVRERALNLLARVGLAEKANEYPKRLSGGQ